MNKYENITPPVLPIIMLIFSICKDYDKSLSVRSYVCQLRLVEEDGTNGDTSRQEQNMGIRDHTGPML
jgi:hypothetical protein